LSMAARYSNGYQALAIEFADLVHTIRPVAGVYPDARARIPTEDRTSMVDRSYHRCFVCRDLPGQGVLFVPLALATIHEYGRYGVFYVEEIQSGSFTSSPRELNECPDMCSIGLFSPLRWCLHSATYSVQSCTSYIGYHLMQEAKLTLASTPINAISRKLHLRYKW
jgi:hypothetical protein